MRISKSLVWVCFVAGLFGVLIWQFWWAPTEERKATGVLAPRFRIAAETTFITEPLDADGYPDYGEALNRRLAKAVDPENNRVVALLKATGPRPLGMRPLPPGFYERLGVPAPAETGDYLISLKPFLQQNRALDSDKIEEILHASRDVGGSTPWKKEEHPEIAAWLERNRLPRQVAIAALQKPGFYDPPIKSTQGGSNTAFYMDFSWVCQELVGQMNYLALLAIGEGNGSKSMEHLLTGLRMTRSFPPRHSFDIHSLERLEQFLYRTVHVLLEKNLLSKAELEELARQINAIAPLPTAADLVDQRLRLLALDRALLMNKSGTMGAEFALAGLSPDRDTRQETERIKSLLNLHAIDFNRALSIINEWFDRSVNDLRITDTRLRHQAVLQTQMLWQEKIMAALEELEVESKRFFRSQKAATAMATFVGLNIAHMAIRASMMAQTISDETEEQRRLLLTSIALERYRKETGTYPESLKALTPTYLKDVPLDLFSGLLPQYAKTPAGYLLYSVGVDGIDSGGRNRSEDRKSDDIAIRVPTGSMN